MGAGRAACGRRGSSVQLRRGGVGVALGPGGVRPAWSLVGLAWGRRGVACGAALGRVGCIRTCCVLHNWHCSINSFSKICPAPTGIVLQANGT